MNRNFKQKIAVMMLGSAMMNPLFLLKGETELDWEVKEEVEIVEVIEITARNGEGEAGYDYKIKGDGEEFFIEENKMKIFTGNDKNQLKKTKRVYLGTNADGKPFYATHTEYEFQIREDLIEEQMRETALDEDEDEDREFD